MKIKQKFSGFNLRLFAAVSSLVFLAAGCGPFDSGSTAAGVVKTTNGGADWTAVNKVVSTNKANKTKASGTLLKSDIQMLAFDPGASDHVFAVSSTSGVYESVNSGDEWKQILSKVIARSIVIDPTDAKHIYVTGSAGGHGKIIETKDGGKTWTEIYNEANPETSVYGIALNPDKPIEVVAAAKTGNFIKSNDGGQTWTLMQNFKDQVVQLYWQDGTIYILLKTKGLFKSRDGGQSFVSITAPLVHLSDNNTQSSSVPREGAPQTISLPTTSVSKFNFSSVSRSDWRLLYIATDLGLFKSTDEGNTWTFIKLPLKNADLFVTTTVIGPDNSMVFASAGNTIYKSLNAGASWQVQAVATGGAIDYILVDQKLPQIVYAGITGRN